MTLTSADVAEIMKLVEQSSFDELTLEMDGIKLTLRRGAAANGAGGAPLVDARFGDAGSGGSAAHAPVGAAAASASHATGSGSAAGGPHVIASGSAALAAGAAGSPPGAAQAINIGSAAPASAGSGAGATRGAPAAPAPVADPNVKDVPAPLLGTFYRAPKPGAPPFVEVGSTVEEDTVVAIIEVMKLMNTVRAGVRGTVTEILARDGALVEYGETLLRVRKAG